MIIRSSISIKGVSRIYKPLIHLLHSFLITEESTPKSLFRWFYLPIIIRISLRFFNELILFCKFIFVCTVILFLFGYILMIYFFFCWLAFLLLLVDILRFFSKSCFLWINILSIIRDCIKRIIKLSFFF